jgi:flagellar biosynthesis/type III secretory pathway M-ring protein FliF/YscJ
MTNSTTAPKAGFLGLVWSPAVIAGFSVGAIILVLLVAVLIWFIAMKTCCKRKTSGEEKTADGSDSGPPVSSDDPNNPLIQLMKKNPKVKSVSQYGKPS